MNKLKAFFVAVGMWFKKVGIAIGKWFKNWFVKVDDKEIIPVRIGKWFKSLFVATEGKEAGFVTLYKKDGTKSVIASLISIFAGLLLGFIIMLIMAIVNKKGIGEAFKGLRILFGGAFFTGSSSNINFGYNSNSLGSMVLRATPLIMTGLSVAIAFKTGLFNIGAPGQYLMGTMASLLVALGIPVGSSFGGFCVWLLAVLAGFVAGALWGAIPGMFKALLGVNEVIVCIMTNWIAANLVSWVFSASGLQNVSEGKTAYIMPTRYNNVTNPRLGMDLLFPDSWADGTFLIAIVIAVVVFIMLNKTTFGFELKACGSNRNSAKYVGMNDKRNIVLSMAIAGGLAALGGAFYFLNGKTEFAWDTSRSLPDVGFNGIPVALLASSNPVGVIFSAVFMAYLNIGGSKLTMVTSFNEYLASIIVAVIVYFAGFSKLIREMLSFVEKKKKDKKGTNTQQQEPQSTAPQTSVEEAK